MPSPGPSEGAKLGEPAEPTVGVGRPGGRELGSRCPEQFLSVEAGAGGTHGTLTPEDPALGPLGKI